MALPHAASGVAALLIRRSTRTTADETDLLRSRPAHHLTASPAPRTARNTRGAGLVRTFGSWIGQADPRRDWYSRTTAPPTGSPWPIFHVSGTIYVRATATGPSGVTLDVAKPGRRAGRANGSLQRRRHRRDGPVNVPPWPGPLPRRAPPDAKAAAKRSRADGAITSPVHFRYGDGTRARRLVQQANGWSCLLCRRLLRAQRPRHHRRADYSPRQEPGIHGHRLGSVRQATGAG